MQGGNTQVKPRNNRSNSTWRTDLVSIDSPLCLPSEEFLSEMTIQDESNSESLDIVSAN